MAEGFLLGPDLLARTRRTIETVEGGVVGSGFRAIPTVLEGETPASQKVFRICEFTGAWSIGAVKTVKLKYVEGATNTVDVTNLFFPIPGSTSTASVYDCAIAKDGTAWFLISPTFETATAVFVQATASQTVVTSVVVATSSFNYLTGISIAASFNTSNCSISVTPTPSTASATVASGITRTTAAINVVTGTQTATILTFKV